MRTKRLLAYGKKLIKQNKPAVFTFLFLGILVDIGFIPVKSDGILFGLLGIYVFEIYICRLPSKTSFLICFIILTAIFLGFLVTGPSFFTEKAAVWLFLFMLIGILQELFFKRR